MAPVPKKKHTRARSNKRKNAASNLPHLPTLVKCSNCGKLKYPHKVCPSCGSYK